MMKKLLKGLMAVALALTVTACGGNNETEETNKISVAISPDYAPYELKQTDGTIEGFDIDMMDLFKGYLEEMNGEAYEFELVEMEFDGIIASIQGDQVDLGISGFTYDEDRVVEWSDPYLGTSQVAVVPEGSSITSVDDLKGKVIAAQSGTTGQQCAEKIENADVQKIGKVTDIFNGLSANQYDAAIVDLGVAKNYVANGGFVMIEEALLDEKNYIIAKQGNTEMIELMNKCIEKMLTSDEYQDLCNKHGLTPLSE